MKQEKAITRQAMSQERKHLFDKPENVSRVIRLLAGICLILFILDFILDRHGKHPWEHMPGFYALYGLVGCVLLVIIAKWMRIFLKRPPDYYHREKRTKGKNLPQAGKSGETNVAP